MAEGDAVVLFDALARLGEGLPAVGADAHVQRGRHLLATGAVAMADTLELGGNDLGVVENQRVASLQEGREIADAMIRQVVFRTRIDDEQARAVARLGGP